VRPLGCFAGLRGPAPGRGRQNPGQGYLIGFVLDHTNCEQFDFCLRFCHRRHSVRAVFKMYRFAADEK
jgi:hypothetical protein